MPKNLIHKTVIFIIIMLLLVEGCGLRWFSPCSPLDLTVFEIALVRDKSLLTRTTNNPLAVILRTSEKLQPDFICHFTMQS